MTVYYKAVRPDGTDFYSGKIKYEGVVTHPKPGAVGSPDAEGYLSVSTSKADCTGFDWPARLFEVEPVGETWEPHPANLPNKVACHSLRVVRELPAHELFGPQGEYVVALMERCKTLTSAERRSLDAARDATWGAAWGAAWDAAWDASRGAARGAARAASRGAARGAARAAARALIARDQIGDKFTQAHYDLLTGPWRKVVGKIHPDDPDLA